MSRHQRIELLLFSACFFAFAYFNQGGGWNQNSRFAEVRAIVEEGRFAIDDFLVFKKLPGTDVLARLKVERAEYDWNGERHHLSWDDMNWTPFPIDEDNFPLEPGVQKAHMVSDCSSGDLSYVSADGHFHPNKPPGTSLLAVPGYFIIYHIERLFHIHPDHWFVMNMNMWLASVCSVGLISALGCVLFFRLARSFAGGGEKASLPALLTTFAFAFGTTFFPFSTILFDHDLTASLLVAAMYGLHVANRDGQWRWAPAFGAGVCGGLAVLTNYVAVLGVAILGLYALLKGGSVRNWRSLDWKRALYYCAGGAAIVPLLFAYNLICYKSLLALSNDFQNPLFHDERAFLGMFIIPVNADDWGFLFYKISLLLISPWRGIFYLAPVLLMGVWGLFVWSREKRWAEVLTCAGIFLAFFGVNALFNGYHAGFSAGPRYLVPGIPFLALPIVAAFRNRVPSIFAGVLIAISVFTNLILTVTDAQNPVGIGGHVRIEGRRLDPTYNLVTEYAWPLFWEGKATPLLDQLLALQMEKERVRIAEKASSTEERIADEQAMEKSLRDSIANGEQSPFLLASIRGPVSVNPLGAFEGLFEYRLFLPGSPQCRWASFNVGEFLWEGSRWSLLPLLLVTGGLGAWAILLARPTTSLRSPK